jgi:hypothetical protein
MIDIVNQHLVLLINRVRAGFKLFVPLYHGSGRNNYLVSKVSTTRKESQTASPNDYPDFARLTTFFAGVCWFAKIRPRV